VTPICAYPSSSGHDVARGAVGLPRVPLPRPVHAWRGWRVRGTAGARFRGYPDRLHDLFRLAPLRRAKCVCQLMHWRALGHVGTCDAARSNRCWTQGRVASLIGASRVGPLTPPVRESKSSTSCCRASAGIVLVVGRSDAVLRTNGRVRLANHREEQEGTPDVHHGDRLGAIGVG
jgi:hypothetical protein